MRIEAPVRVLRRSTQTYPADADRVFPLLCPVREAEWVAGWDPWVVFTQSGRVEPGCVFLTPDGPDTAIWTTVEHDAQRHRLRLLKVVPEVTVCDIRIELTPESNSRCRADLSYEHTALGPRGERLCAELSQAAFEDFSQRWQQALTAWLNLEASRPDEGGRP